MATVNAMPTPELLVDFMALCGLPTEDIHRFLAEKVCVTARPGSGPLQVDMQELDTRTEADFEEFPRRAMRLRCHSTRRRCTSLGRGTRVLPSAEA